MKPPGGAPAPLLIARELRAMNADIRLVAAGSGAERRLARASAWLPAYESRFSRFRERGELSALNASAGQAFRASPSLFALVQLALEFARRSDGIFDPTVLRSLEDAGYNRSFELVTGDAGSNPRRKRQGSWRDVRVEAATSTIVLPPTLGIDLGGLGKGFAVDRVASILGSPSFVNCGGDVFAAGRPPAEESWRIGVSDPFHPERDLMVLTVVDRGVATSSTMHRRWKLSGGEMHHLIDPRTGQPSDSDAVQVTVAAPKAIEADYQAKIVLLLGTEAGIRYLNTQPDVEGLAVRRDGALFQSEAFGVYWQT